jgi:hypothetical protein
VGTPPSATVTIIDDEPPLPVVTITASDGTATENNPADRGIFTVSRTGSTVSSLGVSYTIGGSAVSGTDYQSLSGTLTIPAGQTTAPITVVPIDDNAVEGNETVVVTLSGNSNYTVGTPGSATVTIVDNDVPAGPSLVVTPGSVAPGATVTASWSGIGSPAGRDWIGLYAQGAGNGSYIGWMYVSCSQSPGAAQGSGSCPFTIPGNLANGTYELRFLSNDGYVSVATSNPITVSTVTLPVVTIVASDGTATENNPADTGIFTVSRSGSTAGSLNVNYTIGGSATNGTDYQSLSGTVTIAAGQSTATITVTPIDDSIAEGNETVVLTLSGNANYVVGTPASATVIIIDNDVPPGPSLTATPGAVAVGGNVTGSWSGIGSPAGRDWIGLYAMGAGDGSYWTWIYVSCSQSPGNAQPSGSCPLGIPGVPNGSYELRLFSNDGFSRLATSNSFTVN